MGSRSYFHYSDITTVVSKGKYVGLDPLNAVRDGGWEVQHAASNLGSLSAPYLSLSARSTGLRMHHARRRVQVELSANDPAVAEARRLFPPEITNLCTGFEESTRGAAFRLPLRTKADFERESQTERGFIGREFTPEEADAKLNEWAEDAPRLQLFLSSVAQMTLWRWRAGAAEPERVAEVTKEWLSGSPRPRLPPDIPDKHTRTYALLREYILGLDGARRSALSHMHSAVVRIRSSGGHSVEWLVVGRLDLLTPAVLQAIQAGCDAVPVVGLALRLSPGHGELVGAPYCFLPIGSMRTGLPLHINGSFIPISNRRTPWR